MASIRDVARRAGVSTSTVSRVISRKIPVDKRTGERVMRAIRELDYRPNQLARGLVTRRSYTIGIVAIGAAFYGPAQMIVNIDRSLSQRGYGLTMTTIREFTYENVRAAIHALARNGRPIRPTGAACLSRLPSKRRRSPRWICGGRSREVSAGL